MKNVFQRFVLSVLFGINFFVFSARAEVIANPVGEVLAIYGQNVDVINNYGEVDASYNVYINDVFNLITTEM